MAKKPTRSEADEAPGAAAEGAPKPRPRARREVGPPTVAGRESDATTESMAERGGPESVATRQPKSTERPEAIGGSLEDRRRVQQSPGDAVSARTTSRSARRSPSEEEIRVLAYEIYVQRGRQHGADFDDWLRAEEELKKRG